MQAWSRVGECRTQSCTKGLCLNLPSVRTFWWLGNGKGEGRSGGGSHTVSLSLHLSHLRDKAPKEKPSQPVHKPARQGPTDEAQMAAAAALARLQQQQQPKSRGPTSQDSIRNQGAPISPHQAQTPCPRAWVEALTLPMTLGISEVTPMQALGQTLGTAPDGSL